MSDVKRLLAEATPLPWWAEKGGWIQAEGFDEPVGKCLGADLDNKDRNAALIVYAVNRLPGYEAAVEALTALVRQYDAFVPETRLPILSVEIGNARAALARLREKVPSNV